MAKVFTEFIFHFFVMIMVMRVCKSFSGSVYFINRLKEDNHNIISIKITCKRLNHETVGILILLIPATLIPYLHKLCKICNRHKST